MKNILISALLAILVSLPANAATCTTTICKTDGTMTFNSGSTLTAASGSTVTLSGTTSIADATVTSLTVNGTSGTAITAIRFASDAVASGQTSKTVTLTGVTASSKCVGSANEVATNGVYIRSVAPGTDQVVVTTSGDPGASNLDVTVMCMN